MGPDVELVPGTGMDWPGAARMARARLAAYGPDALDELDVTALRRAGIDPTVGGPGPQEATGPDLPVEELLGRYDDGLPAEPEFHDGNPEDEVAAIIERHDLAARAARMARREAAQPGHLAAGVLRRDDAMDRAEEHAPDDWKAAARTALRELAERHPELTGDDLWTLVPKPAEPRASGPLFRWAAREGLIAPTDRFVPTTQATSHASPSRVWKSLTYRGD